MLSIEQKLDLVLRFIIKNEPVVKIVKKGRLMTRELQRGHTDYNQIATAPEILDNDIFDTELQKILTQLVNDKFIELRQTPESIYKTTIKGLLHIGYEKQKILDEEAVTKALRMETWIKSYNRRLLWATWSAGIAAVLLLLWQVWIWFYPVHAN